VYGYEPFPVLVLTVFCRPKSIEVALSEMKSIEPSVVPLFGSVDRVWWGLYECFGRVFVRFDWVSFVGNECDVAPFG